MKRKTILNISQAGPTFSILAILCLAALPTWAVAEEDERNIPTIDWNTTIDKFQFDSEKFVGQRLTVHCPPVTKEVNFSGLQGTDFYPSDSAICVAALHAGVITTAGGTVTLQLNPGREEYQGSEHQGVRTSDRPATRRSIAFVTKSNRDEMDKLLLENIPTLDWDVKFTRSGFAYRHLIGQQLTFRSPPAPRDRKMRLVFGTDAYDFSSHIFQAALHAGKLTENGGLVTVQINGKVPRLLGSLRNGVETRSKGSGDRTISFVETPVDQRRLDGSTLELSAAAP